MTAAAYQPTQESLNAHRAPDWFDDAKFGVFIHWGPYSVPGFAPKSTIAETFQTNYDRAMVSAPYAEWYWNAMKAPDSPTAEFHRANFPGKVYQDFAADFAAGLEGWDPAAWAAAFHDAGARYVVLVTKHHDGFCLWPTANPSPYERNWRTERDVVGELAAAVRARGLRFGVYYSGGVDWTFRRQTVRTLTDYIASMPGGAYPRYAMGHMRELIARYQPDILWNDIKWPTSQAELFRLFADYYDAHPDGVVNDRWNTRKPAEAILRWAPARALADIAMKKAIAKNPSIVEGFIPAPIPHSDFRTPEYRKFDQIQPKKWESTRGVGQSFGYNRAEQEADYASVESLISDLVDCASKNGNFLLNVGPRGDAQIPAVQLSRLAGLGDWLRRHGEAIYGARPWSRAEAVTTGGLPVRITARAGEIYLIVLGAPVGTRLVIRGLDVRGPARRVGAAGGVTTKVQDGDLVIEVAQPLAGEYAPVFAVSAR